MCHYPDFHEHITIHGNTKYWFCRTILSAFCDLRLMVLLCENQISIKAQAGE